MTDVDVEVPAGQVIREFIDRAYVRLPAAKPKAPPTPWSRMTPAAKKRVAAHLAEHHGITPTTLTELDGGVFRVDRSDGPPWIARVFGTGRPRDAVEGDAEILAFLEEQGFPAERVATPDPVTQLDDHAVLVTAFVEGTSPPGDAASVREIGELIGRLQAMPCDSGARSRPAGGWHGLSLAGGGRRADVDALLPLLADAQRCAPPDKRAAYDSLRSALETVDLAEDLPQALIHVDLGGPNVLRTADGELVAIDWAGAGRGTRVHGITPVMAGAGNPSIVDAFVAGFGAHVRLEPEELDRLVDALVLHSLVLSCWGAVFAPAHLDHFVGSVAGERAAAEAVAARVREAFVAR